MLRGLTAAVAACMASAPVAALSQTNMQLVTYHCDRAVDLSVVYINPPDEPGLAVMRIEGKLVPLRTIPTGSAARYVALDEQDSYRLYTRGDEAFVTHLAADHTATEVPILSDCRATR